MTDEEMQAERERLARDLGYPKPDPLPEPKGGQ